MLRQLLGTLIDALRGRASPPAARGAGDAARRGGLREAFEALLWREDYEGALALAEDAAARDPGSYEGRLLLGRALQKLHRPEEARGAFADARRLREGDPELHDFLGALHQETGRLAEAIAEYGRALELRPDFPLAAFHLGMARLLAGDFARGWDGYALRTLGRAPVPGTVGVPRWDGSPLEGRTIFVAREQGLGDEIMFASLLPELLARGGRCVLECDPRLVALLQRSFPAATVLASGPEGGLPPGAPRPDAWIEAGGLPALWRRRREDFPRHAGYLRADPAKVERWRERLRALGPGLKVGLAWSGGVRMTRSALRSIPLDRMAPLLRVPGARFVSLQYAAGAGAEAARVAARDGVPLVHWQEAIDDYDETAALVAALDLVVSVCTAVVHLAGALGRPAWVLAPLGPEWRYGAEGEGMPWYPSVRIHRQTNYGAWEPLIADVAQALQRRAQAPAADADALEREGAMLARERRYAQAADVLRRAVDAEPGRSRAANLAGMCLTLEQRFPEATRCYDAALAADPSLADAWLNAAWTRRLAGDEAANRCFRRWLELATEGDAAYALPAPARRLALPGVALACLDSAYPVLAARALRACVAAADFGDAVFLGERDAGVPGVRFARVEGVHSLQAYSNFMVHRLHEQVRTPHVLVVQYDGFILHPQAWDPAFLDYDYIGPAVRLPDGSSGGIGGFSLRSRRLLEALRDDPEVRGYDAFAAPYAEDVAICCAFRRVLERRHGIRFAPAELADRFAAEAIAPTAATFGFHSLMQLATLLRAGFRVAAAPSNELQAVFRADSPLGPLEERRGIELRSRGDAWARFLPPG